MRRDAACQCPIKASERSYYGLFPININGRVAWAIAVTAWHFRADLYYRINGLCLAVPPLRAHSRLDDLIDAVLAGIGDGMRALSAEARAMRLADPWPGNTRELKHALGFADAMADPDEALAPAHFPDLASTGHTEVNAGGLLLALEEDAIMRTLRASNGDVRVAAQKQGISRATLYRRLQGRLGWTLRGDSIPGNQ